MLSMKRRAFMKLAAATAVAATLSPRLASAKLTPDKPHGQSMDAPDAVRQGVQFINGKCLMCVGRCGFQAKVKDGVLIKLDGNPYHPNSHDYVVKGDDVKPGDLKPNSVGGFDLGSLCPKGAAGIATLYSPVRLTHPLKRVGPRGSRKFKRISWKEALDAVVEGGNLFGEGTVQGMRALNSNEPLGAADSDFLDEAPSGGYGPKRNLFMWMRGRGDFRHIHRRFTMAYGSANHQSHWDLCELTRQQTGGKVFDGYDAELKGDFHSATYLINIGSSVFDADFPAQQIARHVSKYYLRRSNTKAVHVNPRLTKGGGRMHEWIPLRPATDAAFFMGLIRASIDNNLINTKYLGNPNAEVAKAQGFVNWTDATYLVKKASPRGYVKTGDDNTCVVGGKKVAAKTATSTAELDFSDADSQTVYSMWKERALSWTADQYDDFCGLPRGTIARIAQEAGTAEALIENSYKGPSQQSNGTHAELAKYGYMTMMARYGPKGGMSGGGGTGYNNGLGFAAPVDTSKGGRHDSGTRVCRGRNEYSGKKATATRQWYPLGAGRNDGIQRSVYEGIANDYPYKLKMIWHGHMSNPLYTMMRPQPVEAALKKVPFHVITVTDMNETAIMADIVMPDGTYLEKWTAHVQPPHNLNRSGAYPVGIPVVGGTNAEGIYIGVHPDVWTVEEVVIQVATKLGLDNFGKNGGGAGKDIMHYRDQMEIILNGGDFKGGLDPNSDHIKMGGLFKNPGLRYANFDGKDDPNGKWIRTAPRGLIHLYGVMDGRTLAEYKNAMTGKYYDAIPNPGRRFMDSKENEIKEDEAKYPYELITYKPWQHTQARTAVNLWLMSLQPENGLEMNSVDAAKEGVTTGDWVEAENPEGVKVKMKVVVTDRIRPGVMAVSQSFGRWEAGARSFDIDGTPSPSDRRVGAGFQMNWLARADPALPGDASKNPCPGDVMCGSAHQYGGYRIRLKRLGSSP